MFVVIVEIQCYLLFLLVVFLFIVVFSFYLQAGNDQQPEKKQKTANGVRGKNRDDEDEEEFGKSGQSSLEKKYFDLHCSHFILQKLT